MTLRPLREPAFQAPFWRLPTVVVSARWVVVVSHVQSSLASLKKV